VEELLGKAANPAQPASAHSGAATALAVLSMPGAALGLGKPQGPWHNGHPHMLLAWHPKMPICS